MYPSVPLGRHPPLRRHPLGRHPRWPSGRYVSYWSAFLFVDETEKTEMASLGSKTVLGICEMCESKSKSLSTGSQSTANLGKKLMEAARLGCVECVNACLAAGDGVNTFDKERLKEILSAPKGGQCECLNELIVEGDGVNSIDNDRFTPLILAAKGGHYECVNLLIHAGADVNRCDSDGFTALMMASMGGHAELKVAEFPKLA